MRQLLVGQYISSVTFCLTSHLHQSLAFFEPLSVDFLDKLSEVWARGQEPYQLVRLLDKEELS